MAIKPNREGLNPKYIDKAGRVIVEKDTATPTRVATLENKVGDLYFRVVDDKPQYKNGESGDWSDFNSGGGVATLITTLSTSSWSFNDSIPVNSTGYNALIIELSTGFDSALERCLVLKDGNWHGIGLFRQDKSTYFYRDVKATDTHLTTNYYSDTYRALPRRVWGVNIVF